MKVFRTVQNSSVQTVQETLRAPRAGWRFTLGMLCVAFMAGCATFPEKVSARLLEEEILAQERRGLEALKTGDVAQFAHSTAEDAVFIDSHGVATKAEVMKNVSGFRLVDFTMTEVKLVPLSAHAGLLVYTLTETGNSHGHEFKAKVYVSSLWEKNGNEWYCHFSQETGAK